MTHNQEKNEQTAKDSDLADDGIGDENVRAAIINPGTVLEKVT